MRTRTTATEQRLRGTVKSKGFGAGTRFQHHGTGSTTASPLRVDSYCAVCLVIADEYPDVGPGSYDPLRSVKQLDAKRGYTPVDPRSREPEHWLGDADSPPEAYTHRYSPPRYSHGSAALARDVSSVDRDMSHDMAETPVAREYHFARAGPNSSTRVDEYDGFPSQDEVSARFEAAVTSRRRPSGRHAERS